MPSPSRASLMTAQSALKPSSTPCVGRGGARRRSIHISLRSPPHPLWSCHRRLEFWLMLLPRTRFRSRIILRVSPHAISAAAQWPPAVHCALWDSAFPVSAPGPSASVAWNPPQSLLSRLGRRVWFCGALAAASPGRAAGDAVPCLVGTREIVAAASIVPGRLQAPWTLQTLARPEGTLRLWA